MSGKYLGLKSANDLAGAAVRIVRPVQNGYGSLPAGSTGIISNAVGFVRDGNLHFLADKCSCCGVQLRISGLKYSDFELIVKQDAANVEANAVEKLAAALKERNLQPNFVSAMKEIDPMGWDAGAYAELPSGRDDHDDSIRFAQDVQSGNVYVSFNDKCHDFGVVNMNDISLPDLVSALSAIVPEHVVN